MLFSNYLWLGRYMKATWLRNATAYTAEVGTHYIFIVISREKYKLFNSLTLFPERIK